MDELHLDLDPSFLEGLPQSPETALLRSALRDGEPPPSRRIFVNRNLRMETIRFIGFDLDWTVAPYYRLPLEELIFSLALDRLVARFDYPPTIRQAEFRPHFPHRGLIIDRGFGTVLKMNRHRYVGRAYLGREILDRHERARLYRKERLDLKSERFYWVDTLFELPEVNLFAELVELRRLGRVTLPEYDRLFLDVRAAVDGVHGEGPLKARIAADLPRYLPRERELALALHRLQLGDRKLMLVTNSDWEYTDRVCSYLFDGTLPGLDDWRQLFALVVVSAGKPGFFRRARPFVELDGDGQPLREVEVPEWGNVYTGGSRAGLTTLMGSLGEEVLYVGDHIYGDIVSSKLTSTWRTALVLRELEEELEMQSELAPQIRHLQALKSELASMGHHMDDLHDVLHLYGRLAAEGLEVEAVSDARRRLEELRGEHRALRHRAGELQEGIAMRFNPSWGSVFKQGGSQSLFGSQVDDFSCIYTARVANFANYGANHYFRVLTDPMAHDVEP
ncbi:MAG TPA: HAD-IG family 5'-nucleotidase [Thermoanaerobaculia bacterium]|nr:HAD-IG family 5'-nucleotidase [Thermoanaerobaculia bacterium]